MLQHEPLRPAPHSPVPGSPAPSDSARSELAPVLDLLVRARQRRRALLYVTAGGFALSGLLLVLLLLALPAAGGHSWARIAAGVAVAAAAAGFGYFGWWRARREVGDLSAAARLLVRRGIEPALRRDLLPAFELGRQLDSGAAVDFSPELARAHIESVGSAARRADLIRAFPDHQARKAVATFAATAFVVLAAAIVGERVSRGFAFLLSGEGKARAAAPVAEPVTGEIELTYTYPAYTRLDPRTVPNTNGEISAPRGTQVRMRTRADRDLAQAFAVVGDNALPLEVSGGRDLSGTVLVDKPGGYHFRFLDKRGRVLVDGPKIPINVEADAVPKANIVSPATDMEVDPRARVPVRFEAEDDFGLSEVALVYQLPGSNKPERLLLQRSKDSPRRASGEYAWEVASLGLLAGDRVAYHLEATDNDEISGKKTGASRTQYLKIYSEAEHHRQVIKRIEESWEKLVGLLGDRLEGPDRKAPGRSAEKILAQAPLDTRAQELVRELGELATTLKKEKAPEQLWRALINVSSGLNPKVSATVSSRSALSVWLKRGVALDSEPVRRLDTALTAEIAEEERDVLYLEALLDEQRIEDLLALSKELNAKRRDLADVLEKYRTAPDQATKEKLLSELARLKERMAELMQRMAELSKGINDEHVNAEALKEMSDSMKSMDSFDKIQEALRSGNVEEAMKEMENLGQMLDQMDQQLRKAGKDFSGGGMKELGKELGDFASQLDQLQKDEEQVLKETQEVRQGAKKAFDERLAKKGADFVQRMKKKVEESRNKLGQIGESQSPFRSDSDLRAAKESLQELDDALSVKDFDQASQAAAKALGHAQMVKDDLQRIADETRRYPGMWQKTPDEAQKDLKNAQGGMKPIQDLQQELGELFPAPGQSMSDEDKQKMRGLSQRQGSLQQQAGKLQQQMGELNKKAPIFNPDAQQMMQQAGERMGKAQGQLSAKNPSGASAEERASLDQLGQLKKGLQQKSGQGQGQGQGIPWPWVGPGMQRGEDGTDGPNNEDEKMAIPGADQYQVPEEYRKEILDAMKQRAPDKYKEQVKRYYEEIVK